MKVFLSLVLLVLCVKPTFAQFDGVSAVLEQAILDRSVNDSNATLMKGFIDSYRQAEVLSDEEELLKDYVGVCMETYPSAASMLFPAKYSVDEIDNQPYFNLAMVHSAKESTPGSLDEYIKRFLNQPGIVSKCEFFTKLKYIGTIGNGRMETAGGGIVLVDSRYVSFLKKKDNMIYAIAVEISKLYAAKSMEDLLMSDILLYTFNTTLISNEDYLLISREKKKNKIVR